MRPFISSWTIFRDRDKAVRVGVKLKKRADRRTGTEHPWLQAIDRDGLVLVDTGEPPKF